VVLAKSHTGPGDIAETVLGYLCESDEQPTSLFRSSKKEYFNKSQKLKEI
jgi:hypothetical protein